MRDGWVVREYRVEFLDGPFAGRHALVRSARSLTCPMFLYVLPDGGIVSPDLIIAAGAVPDVVVRHPRRRGRHDRQDRRGPV
jgi:hypothetical protein